MPASLSRIRWAPGQPSRDRRRIGRRRAHRHQIRPSRTANQDSGEIRECRVGVRFDRMTRWRGLRVRRDELVVDGNLAIGLEAVELPEDGIWVGNHGEHEVR